MVTWKGVGTYSLELLRALAPRVRADELRLLCFRRPEDGFLERDAGLAGLEWRTIAGSVWSQLSAAAMAHEARGTHLFHSPHFVVPAAYGGPIVATIFDVIPLDRPETMPNPVARTVFRRAVGFAARRADMVLCLTRYAAARLAAHDIRPHDLRVIPGAAAPGFRRADPTEVDRVCRKYGLTRGYVLWLGAFRAHKNVGRLVDAYRQLPPGLALGHPLVLAGSEDGPEVAGLRLQAAKTGRPVLFPGRIEPEDLAALYTGAAVFVFPSLAEGFGLPPLEAAACGTPVLCSRADPLREVMGRGAAYFDPLDASGLAELMETVLTSAGARDALAEAGSRQAARSSWRTTAELTLQAFRDVLSRREPAG
jgi:glycosyltransferase involved in cell wall biosynthesis